MRRTFALCALLFAMQASRADTVLIPLGAQGSAATAASLPARGQSEAAVRQRFGEPEERHPAVGTPPIERWDYTDFSVYFESGQVVHSVLRHRPTRPAD